MRNTGELGPAPSEWIEKAKISGRCAELLSTWLQIVAQDVLGVLNVSHRLLVENTCYLQYKIRLASKGIGKATSGDHAQMKANLAAMGQTPADSARVAEGVRLPGQGSGSSGERPGGAWGDYVGKTG